MSARRLTKCGPVWLCVIVGWAFLFSTSAVAARSHVLKGVIGEPCSTEPCGTGQLNQPGAVAVNEATGDVYVVDQGDDRVEYFTSSGAYLGQFNGSGLLSNEGKAAGGGGLPTESETGQFFDPGDIAIDNACQLHVPVLSEVTTPTCHEFDPSAGDIYVLDAGHRVVDKYSPNGEYVGQLFIQATPALIDGISVDPSGTVWVYRNGEGFSGELDSYNDAIVNVRLSTRFVREHSAQQGAGLFVTDPKGGFDYFYIVATGNGFERVASAGEGIKLGGNSEEPFTENFSLAKVTGLAIEPSTHDIYADASTALVRYDVNGATLEQLGGGSLGGGVGVSSTTETVYAADSSAGIVDVFAPVPPGAPTVGNQAASFVTANSATLDGAINPEGIGSEYHFEYGPSTSYGESVPVPDRHLGADFEIHEVELHLQDLLAHTTYHFRIVARNSAGTTYGEDKVFNTQVAGSESKLPDNRAWELVTPAQKQGALFYGLNLGFYENGAAPFVTKASSDGDAVVNLASSPTEAEPQGSGEYASVLSTRTSEGWSSRVITVPHEEGTGPSVGKGGEYGFFSEDLSHGVLSVFGNFDRQLSPEATEATPYLRTNYLNGNLGERCETSCYRPLVTASNTRPGAVFGEEINRHCEDVLCGPRLIDATPDASHVVLSSSAQLTVVQNEEGSYQNGQTAFYEWSDGQLQPLYLLPEGEGGTGVFAGELATVGHQLSDNGSVFFSYAGHLYVHDFEKDVAFRLDVAQGAPEPSEGGAKFLFASSDGSKVLFTDEQQLTAARGGGVYECRVREVADNQSCELTLTDVPESSLIGGSDDASLLYFIGAGEKLEVARYREGSWKVTAGPLMGSQPPSRMPTYRVSSNGRYLTFMTDSDLTGYDTRDALSGQPDQEVYLYDAYSDTLSCASCDPTGARPIGVEDKLQMLVAGSVTEGVSIAASLPPWTAVRAGLHRYQPRFLSDSGRLFFNSSDALTPKDVDGTEDVYEYEPLGIGTCEASSTTYSASSGGCVSLISSGSSPEESAFMDASESGSDVFFMTQAKLLPQDFDSAFDVYDAHECDPSAPCYAPAAVSLPPCSTGDSCKAAPTPQPAAFGAPPSATFSGAGNITQPTSSKVAKKALTKPQKLARALRACKKDKHKVRVVCEQKARRRYGTTKSRKARVKQKGKR